MEVTVIIPALNEPYLPKLLEKLKDYKVDVRTEKGLAYAVWRGIQEAKSEIIVVMDADGSHPPEAIPKMVQMLNEETWFVIGSRYVKGGYNYDSFMRRFISLFYCCLARMTLSNKIHDSMSGFWVGWRWAFQFQPTQSYKFGLQLLKKYHKFIKEYPIIFVKRKEGKSHVKPIQALRDLWTIFKEGLKR